MTLAVATVAINTGRRQSSSCLPLVPTRAWLRPRARRAGRPGGSNDQMVAPRRQQFTGDFNYDPAKDGKPLPVRPYAADQPSAYQAAPLWPPAPPEPLFPLKGDAVADDSSSIQPPIPGGFSPMAARL